MMFDLRSDLPTNGDSASSYIPWLVSVMVFLGILAFSGVSVFDTILSGWSRSVSGTLTIQVPALQVDQDAGANAKRADRLISSLETMSAVESVRALSATEVDALLAPWLGDDAGTSNLPLPILIDVSLADDAPQDIDAIYDKVITLVPDAVIDDHRRWFEHLIDLTEGFRLLAVCITAIVTLALALTVVYATRASLAEFKDVIAVFHFIGARDMYVATQFAKRMLLAAGKGSLLGLFLGTLAILSISWLAQSVESGFLPDITFSWAFWLSVPLVALAAMILAMITAYVTVLGVLRNMI